jgi:hypothetical protein
VGTCQLTNLEDDILESTIRYYPNPVSGSLTLELPDGKNRVEVYSLSGSLLSQFTASEAVFEYDMQAFPAGVYLFKVWNKANVSVFRVIK